MELSWRSWAFPGRRATRRRIRRLVIDLERRGDESLEEPLQRALGDDQLRLAFWRDDRGEWVDAEGRHVDLEDVGGDRAVMRVEGPSGPLAALIHDRRLERDRRLMQAVVAAARLALENDRMEAELRARIAELRASRERLVATGDAERRRVERDLHDGAQQRLVALGVGLQVVGMEVAGQADPEGAELLERGLAVAQQAMGELRRIAHGIFPTALADEGLGAALEDLASKAPIAVNLLKRPQVRVNAAAEAAAYFAAAETIAAAARADPEARVGLSARIEGTFLELTVDGLHHFAGELDLLELEDRVDALGGQVLVGPGQRLTVQIPVGAEAA